MSTPTNKKHTSSGGPSSPSTTKPVIAQDELFTSPTITGSMLSLTSPSGTIRNIPVSEEKNANTNDDAMQDNDDSQSLLLSGSLKGSHRRGSVATTLPPSTMVSRHASSAGLATEGRVGPTIPPSPPQQHPNRKSFSAGAARRGSTVTFQSPPKPPSTSHLLERQDSTQSRSSLSQHGGHNTNPGLALNIGSLAESTSTIASPPQRGSATAGHHHRRSSVHHGNNSFGHHSNSSVATSIASPPRFLYDKPKSFPMNRGDHFVTSRNATNIKVGLGWDHRHAVAHCDLDASAICFNAEGKKLDHVSFGRRSTRDFSMFHCGDDKGQDRIGDDESIVLNLQAVAPEVHYIVFLLNVYTTGKSFDDVTNIFARVVDVNFANQNFANQVELLKFTLKPGSSKQTGAAMLLFSRERANVGYTNNPTLISSGKATGAAAAGNRGKKKSSRGEDDANVSRPYTPPAQQGAATTGSTPPNMSSPFNGSLAPQSGNPLLASANPSAQASTLVSPASMNLANSSTTLPPALAIAGGGSPRTRRLSVAAGGGNSNMATPVGVLGGSGPTVPTFGAPSSNVALVQTPSNYAQWRIIALGTPVNGKSHRHVTTECEALCSRIVQGWLPKRQGTFKTGGEQLDLLIMSNKLMHLAKRRNHQPHDKDHLAPPQQDRRESESSASSVAGRSEDSNDMHSMYRQQRYGSSSSNQSNISARRPIGDGDSCDTATPIDIREQELDAMYAYNPGLYSPHRASAVFASSGNNSTLRPKSPGRPRVVRKAIRLYSVGKTCSKRGRAARRRQRQLQRRRRKQHGGNSDLSDEDDMFSTDDDDDFSGDEYSDMTDDEEELIDEAEENEFDDVDPNLLFGAFPQFDSPKVVRYDDHTYNVGTTLDLLLGHYMSHRETYEIRMLENAQKQAQARSSIDDSRYLVDYVDEMEGDGEYDKNIDWRKPPPEILQLLELHAQHEQQRYYQQLQNRFHDDGDSRSMSPGDGGSSSKSAKTGAQNVGRGSSNNPLNDRLRKGGKGGKGPTLMQMLNGRRTRGDNGGDDDAGRLGSYRSGAPVHKHGRTMLSARKGGGSPWRRGEGGSALFAGVRAGGSRKGSRTDPFSGEGKRSDFFKQLGAGSTNMLSKELTRWIEAFLRSEHVKRNIEDPLQQRNSPVGSPTGRGSVGSSFLSPGAQTASVAGTLAYRASQRGDRLSSGGGRRSSPTAADIGSDLFPTGVNLDRSAKQLRPQSPYRQGSSGNPSASGSPTSRKEQLRKNAAAATAAAAAKGEFDSPRSQDSVSLPEVKKPGPDPEKDTTLAASRDTKPATSSSTMPLPTASKMDGSVLSHSSRSQRTMSQTIPFVSPGASTTSSTAASQHHGQKQQPHNNNNPPLLSRSVIAPLAANGGQTESNTSPLSPLDRKTSRSQVNHVPSPPPKKGGSTGKAAEPSVGSSEEDMPSLMAHQDTFAPDGGDHNHDSSGDDGPPTQTKKPSDRPSSATYTTTIAPVTVTKH